MKTGIGAVIRNGTGPAVLPLADPFCEVPTSFECGDQGVSVPPGQLLALTPGTYGFLRVLNGATLRLAPGVYTFCDVKMGRAARIEADGPVLLQIGRNLRIGTGSYFGPINNAPPIAAYVLGRTVRISQGATAVAQITAPFAKSTFGRDATLNGCYCSHFSKSDKHITLTCIE